jgi:dolichol-phosphate mannosyltransferase
LPFDKISKRCFFEIGLLFHLNLRRAVVKDIPMKSRYQGEIGTLIIRKVIPEFLVKSATYTLRRIFYSYYLRDMSLASIQLPIGICLAFFSFFYGAYHWGVSVNTEISSPTGTVALATMTFILSFQLILGFLAQDIASVPKDPIHEDLLEKVS